MIDFNKVDVDKAFETIKSDRIHLITIIDRLREENSELKSEHYKNKELANLKESYDKLKKDSLRGFSISEEESKAIGKWKVEHIKKYHPNALNNPGYFGAVGGNFRYEFVPTSIGTIGTIKCTCGKEEFTFSKLE